MSGRGVPVMAEGQRQCADALRRFADHPMPG
jgi:hypothetical protein